jgi:hypothetical protein
LSWASHALETGDDLSRRRCDLVVPTRPQLDFFQCAALAALWLDGNQLGKTWALLLDLIWRCRGSHPYQRLWTRPPISSLLVSVSHEQLSKPDGVMEKLWTLLPRDEIEDVAFTRGKGFSGKPPVINWRNGSATSFGTFAQPVDVHAGPTLHHIASDEPIPRPLLDELLPRLIRNRGTLRMTFTPTPDMPEQAHLRELCTQPDPVTGVPLVHLINHGLNAENTRPMGAPFPLMSQQEIDRFERMLPAMVRAMRIRGSWDPVITDRHITAWDATVHNSPVTWEAPPHGAYLVGSWDHGLVPGKQVFVVSAFADRHGRHPRAWALGVDIRPGRSSQTEDARAAHALLDKLGLSWRDVDAWTADRAVHDNAHVRQKDNDRLRAAMAEAAGVPYAAFPEIPVPHKTGGSVESGIMLINALCADRTEDGRPCLLVDPVNAEPLARAIETYRGGSRDPAKDRVDAWRYGIERAIDFHPDLVRFVGRH